MVRVQVGVVTKHGYIDPSKQKCLGCGAEFYYPYCAWAGGCYVTPVCPKCRQPIEYGDC